MIMFGYKKEPLEAEIAKCKMLCANCYRKRHAQPPTSKTVAWVTEQNRQKPGCSLCPKDDSACLDFRHIGEKKATVARLAVDERPIEEISAEMDWCVLLCVNCHRRRHYGPPDPERYDTHK